MCLGNIFNYLFKSCYIFIYYVDFINYSPFNYIDVHLGNVYHEYLFIEKKYN